MAQVIQGGSLAYNALAYGTEMHPNTRRYIETKLANSSQYVTEASKSFYTDALDMYNRFNGSEAMRIANAAIRKVKGIFQPEGIRRLETLGDIQNASITMQRWIMAEPETRKRLHNQTCDGYSGSYVDMQPGLSGAQHYDYQLATNGLVVEDPNAETGYSVTQYGIVLAEGDRELQLAEQMDIRSVWDIVSHQARTGRRDHTSNSDASF